MPIVFAQPGIAVDWDWANELTAWSSDNTRVGALVDSYRLTRRPVDEFHATVQARRWWRATASRRLTTVSTAPGVRKRDHE
jgi:hypothetical protein